MRLRVLGVSLLLALASLLPLSTPASASVGHPYLRLAHCESGSRWHLNTHNGYYGGLQFALGTWRAYRGARFAKLPNRASRDQQIRVAKRVRASQGWGAWPACSRKVGLR